MSHWERPGQSDLWQTPRYIFDALGDEFDLDVAAPSVRLHVPCKSFFTEKALERDWHGFVWMNPPFGGRNGLAPWLRKFIAHGDGIALVPDRTSAPWFQEAAARVGALLFLSPKVKFIAPDGSLGISPATGTVLLAAGDRAVRALKRGRSLGILCMVTP